jgi:hypothetical protein
MKLKHAMMTTPRTTNAAVLHSTRPWSGAAAPAAMVGVMLGAPLRRYTEDVGEEKLSLLSGWAVTDDRLGDAAARLVRNAPQDMLSVNRWVVATNAACAVGDRAPPESELPVGDSMRSTVIVTW